MFLSELPPNSCQTHSISSSAVVVVVVVVVVAAAAAVVVVVDDIKLIDSIITGK